MDSSWNLARTGTQLILADGNGGDGMVAEAGGTGFFCPAAPIWHPLSSSSHPISPGKLPFLQHDFINH